MVESEDYPSELGSGSSRDQVKSLVVTLHFTQFAVRGNCFATLLPSSKSILLLQLSLLVPHHFLNPFPYYELRRHTVGT